MNAWWRARAPREQRLLTVGGVVAALLLVWAFVVYPEQRAHRAALEAVSNSERDLAWMRQAAPALRAAGPVVALSAGSGRSLLAQVDATARAAGLASAIGNVEPQPNGRVGVSFNDVSFDALMRWLEPFAAQHGARIEAFSAQRTPSNGLVDARLTLIEAGRG